MSDERASILQEAIASWQHMSRAAWLLGFAAVTSSASFDLVIWSQQRKLDWADAAPVVSISTIWMAAIYVGALAIISRQPNVAGFVRFGLASILGFAPLLVGFAILFAFKPLLGQGARVAIFLVAVAAQLMISAMLPAWSVARALTVKFVSPLRVLRATSGHRWSLLLTASAIGAVNSDKLVPRMVTATNIWSAVAIAFAGMAVGMLTIGFTAAIAAMAWRFATRNDPRLA